MRCACGRTFSSKARLEEHVRTSELHQPTVIPCPWCDKKIRLTGAGAKEDEGGMAMHDTPECPGYQDFLKEYGTGVRLTVHLGDKK